MTGATTVRPDDQANCGLCGKPFSKHRIEDDRLYGRIYECPNDEVEA